MDTGNGLNRKDSNFGQLVKNATDRIVPDAWGGYMDAGDWDRRIQHLVVSRYLLDLADLFPAFFTNLSLNIPESDNDLPDIVDEALFNLDCYRRMQTAEGGIRGGHRIRGASAPRRGELAGVSHDLRLRARRLVQLRIRGGGGPGRALAAIPQARAGRDLPEERDPGHELGGDATCRNAKAGRTRHAVHDARNLAAAELHRLTG